VPIPPASELPTEVLPPEGVKLGFAGGRLMGNDRVEF
jgi:hypothetical protein